RADEVANELTFTESASACPPSALFARAALACLARCWRSRRGGQLSDLAFEFGEALAQLYVLGFGALGARRQVRVVAPPVQPDLLGLINRADEQSDLQRQQFDVGERDLDVARDDQPLVKYPV